MRISVLSSTFGALLGVGLCATPESAIARPSLPVDDASLSAPAVGADETDADALRRAKALFFDRRYTEARALWERILRASAGPEADTAAFQVARCSDNAGESERALGEYQTFLDRRPKDAALAEEARTSRVGLATRLYKEGKKQHLPLVERALNDPSKTVRYYAALQLGGLGAGVGAPAIAVLKEILADEKDADLVDRAKIILWRLDPEALREGPTGDASRPRRSSGQEVKWLRIRIVEKGHSQPSLSLNLPVGLADLAFRSLPDDAVKNLKKEGYDAENFWERLKKLGPTQILEITGEDGERVQIWLE